MRNQKELCSEASAPRCVTGRNAAFLSSRFPLLDRRLAGLLGLLVLLGASASTPARANGAGMNSGPCPPEGMQNCGDPISVATQDKYEDVTDYTSGGSNPLTFSRHYNMTTSKLTRR